MNMSLHKSGHHRIPHCILILGLIILSGSCLAGECLQIHIWTDKNEYLVREQIIVQYAVKNTGDKSIATVFSAFAECFHVYDESGRRYENTMWGCYAGMFDTLPPGDTYQGEEKLSSRYSVFRSGNYKCYLILDSALIYPCLTNITSDSAEFVIREPQGDEKPAFDLYMTAFGLHWNAEKDAQGYEKAFNLFIELGQSYPNSVYAPQCLKYAFFQPRRIDRRKVIARGRELIDQNPNFPVHLTEIVMEGVVAAYKTLGDKGNAALYMNSLIDKYPDSKISERAEFWLGKIQEWEFQEKPQ